jgi:hypothetical protein
VLVALASCNGRYGVQPLLRRPGEIGGERSTGVLVRRAWGCDCRRLHRRWWRKLPRIVSGSRRSGMWGGCWGDGTRFWSWRWPIRLKIGGDWGRLARRARGCGGVGEGGRAVWLSRVEAGCGCVRGGGRRVGVGRGVWEGKWGEGERLLVVGGGGEAGGAIRWDGDKIRRGRWVGGKGVRERSWVVAVGKKRRWVVGIRGCGGGEEGVGDRVRHGCRQDRALAAGGNSKSMRMTREVRVGSRPIEKEVADAIREGREGCRSDRSNCSGTNLSGSRWI